MIHSCKFHLLIPASKRGHRQQGGWKDGVNSGVKESKIGLMLLAAGPGCAKIPPLCLESAPAQRRVPPLFREILDTIPTRWAVVATALPAFPNPYKQDPSLVHRNFAYIPATLLHRCVARGIFPTSLFLLPGP